MFKYIKADISRYRKIDGRKHDSFVGRLFVGFFAYGLHSIIIYRYGRYINRFRHNTYTLPLYFISNLSYLALNWSVIKMYGIDICREADIGAGLYIGHFGGIKVSHCTMGENCNIHQLTKINKHATIGRHVWIGAHAIIEEGVAVADYSSVASASRVEKSVSSFCLVSGNPARTIKINFDNSDMVNV